MTLPVSRLAVALVMSCIAACSAELATPIPHGDGNVAGGAKGAPATDDAGTAAPPTTPPSGSSGGSSGGSEPLDAGAPPVTFEAGPPVYPDAGYGGGYDAGPTTPPTTGPLGSCGNPACATDGNECGCQATDSNGDTVQMGCQAGGECICLVDQQTSTPPFDEDGACSAQASTAAQFLASCQCQ
ncbi:MAG TPA: hypothetical protein VHS09_05580 [Polyangiaceae bacterium]|jgi:hypothetical protein|nr:hypothetical protein [Polyangiaceae bacterium]